MPNITYTYKGQLPYHASHKIDDNWMDICLGIGDTIELPDTAVNDPRILNMINTDILVVEKTEPKKPGAKTKIPAAEQLTDNNSNS